MLRNTRGDRLSSQSDRPRQQLTGGKESRRREFERFVVSVCSTASKVSLDPFLWKIRSRSRELPLQPRVFPPGMRGEQQEQHQSSGNLIKNPAGRLVPRGDVPCLSLSLVHIHTHCTRFTEYPESRETERSFYLNTETFK